MYDLIVGLRFLPGQQVRQEEIAQQLGISRIPVRETLKTLAAEGLLSHSPNRGFFLRTLNPDEFQQMYRMISVLEAEVLRHSRRPAPPELARLRKLNAGLAEAVRTGPTGRIVQLNREFHFALYELSELQLIANEARRLMLTGDLVMTPYRSLILWDEGRKRATKQRIVREHEEMIAHIRRGDTAALVRVAERHRRGGERDVLAVLQGDHGQAATA